MKLYGIQILGNKGTFKILCWIVPSLYSFKSHPSHPLLFYHCEQNATTRNKCTSEFCSGWVISYILLEATHLSTHFSFTIVNKMQMLWNKDVGKNEISFITDILILWFYGYNKYIKNMSANILEKKYIDKTKID